MRNLLAAVERFIADTLQPGFFKKTENISANIEAIRQHLALISDHILDEAVNTTDRNHVTGVTLPYYDALTFQFNKVLDAKRQRIGVAGKEAELHYFKELERLLNDILTMILRLMENDFSPQLMLTDAYAAFVRGEMNLRWEQIMQLSNDHPALDRQLFYIGTRPLRAFIENHNSITFYHLSYLRRLIKQVELALKPGFELDGLGEQYVPINRELRLIDMEVATVNINLHLALAYTNHNAKDYITYCITSLQRKIDSQKEEGMKLRILRLYEKIMKITRSKSKTRLLPDEKSFNQQILDWIKSEMQYIEAVASETPPSEFDEEMDVGVKVKRIEKLNTTFNVRELTLIARLFKLSGRLGNNNTDIQRFISQHFTTEGSDELSYASVNSKWFTPRSATVEKVQEFFEECIRQLRQFK